MGGFVLGRQGQGLQGSSLSCFAKQGKKSFSRPHQDEQTHVSSPLPKRASPKGLHQKAREERRQNRDRASQMSSAEWMAKLRTAKER